MSVKPNMTIYFLCVSIFSAFLSSYYLIDVPAETLRDQIHAILAIGTYAVMYQLPALLTYFLFKKSQRFALMLTVIVSALCHVVIFADSRLFDLYGFHLNGFVWNLITSKGGIESLGADQTNNWLVVGYVSVLLGVQVVSVFLAKKMPSPQLRFSHALLIFLLATLAERGIYGYSKAELYGPVMSRGDAIFLYQPMSMNSFLRNFGVEVKKANTVAISEDETGKLNYPLQPITLAKQQQPMNIIMLVSESMRWDLLTPKIMPNLSQFAEKAWRFDKHYSGGNGTRQGLFSLFYGLPGNYWDLFLRQRKGPVLFDVLNDYGYQYFTYTSARFTYPEFDKTIFNEIPADKLIENNTGEPWKRDVKNTSELISAIHNRQKDKPFFGFIFYEATHARYSFPKNAVINNNFLETLDYGGLSREELSKQIDSMKARYENAAHGIDMQLQRIFEALQQSGDINNTMVIVTGDHGEEFMERGRWGHNSAFTDWQVRVPMVVWLPGEAPKVINDRTSHEDIPTSILSRLGVTNNPSDYTLGQDLGSPVAHRNITVASWSDIGLINDYGKLVIPFKSTTQHQNLATDLNDKVVNGSQLASKMQSLIFKSLNDAKRFKQ